METGRFSLSAVTPDGLLWGMTPAGKLASFDGRSWTDGASWTLYDSPVTVPQDSPILLAAAPDGALWLVTGDALARFDPQATPDEAWTLYPPGDGWPGSYNRALAFGPGGELWFGPTRFQSLRR